jgi:hypothetical protein
MEKFINNYNKFAEELQNLKVDTKLPEKDVEKLDFFVRNWYPHMEPVSKADLTYFQDVNPEIFQGLTFLDLMKKVSSENKNIVWEYLHTLYAFSMVIKETKENYNNPTDENKELFEQIQKTISDFPVLVGNMVNWKKDKKKPVIDESFIENSMLGKLAKEISEDINPEEILGKEDMDPMNLLQGLMSGDKKSNIGKLMSTVCEKVQNKMESGDINQEELLKEAMTLMSSMGGSGGEPNMADIMKMAQGMSMGKNMKSRKVRRRMKKKLKKK